VVALTSPPGAVSPFETSFETSFVEPEPSS
jgi:hypothetical protein